MERCSPTIRSSSLSPPFGQYHLRSWPICSFLFHASIGVSLRHMCWLCFLDNVPMNIYAFLALIGDVENYTNLPVYSRFEELLVHSRSLTPSENTAQTKERIWDFSAACLSNKSFLLPELLSFFPKSILSLQFQDIVPATVCEQGEKNWSLLWTLSC